MRPVAIHQRLRRLTAVLVLVMTLAALGAPRAVAEPAPQGEALSCGQEIRRTNENGTFHLRFQCLPTQGLLNRGFTFDPQWRSMAISPVRESGMRYWQNGTQKSDNSDHEVPVDYIFHGTIPQVFVGDDIEYQDFFTFRANFGPSTGTTRVAVVGSVILKP